MKIKNIIALVLTLGVLTVTAYTGQTKVYAISPEDMENPGDTVDNPWEDLFTDKEPTTAGDLLVESGNQQKVKAPAKVKIQKIATKKKSAKKIVINITKIKNAAGYQVAVYQKKNYATKNTKALYQKTIKKNTNKLVLSSAKVKNKKTLYVRVRAYVLDKKSKKYGAWSKVTKVKIKK